MDKKIYVKDVVKYCDGELICGSEEIECTDFCKDSREVKSGEVYIGIKGANFNGSNYYEQSLKNGAKVCILQDVKIEENIIEQYKNCAIILVKDVVVAIQQLAKYKRTLYDIPVVAITGSVGKTSTKDIIASVLSMKYDVLKTEGNYNNHIGVPLTILRLKNHNAMVVEMGMNNPNEIRVLTEIAKPTVAVITNIGTSHIGNLGSRENILKAKMEIVEGLIENGTLVINNDNDLLHQWNEKQDEIKVKTYGIENKSDLQGYDIRILNGASEFSINVGNRKYEIEVPIGGTHFVYNSLCATQIGLILNVQILEIIQGIKKFELTKSRMETKQVGNITIINDCYNANYDSVKAALEYLGKANSQRKIAILGDMLELGEFSKELHEKVGEEVTKQKIEILIVVGEESKNIARIASTRGMDISKIYVCDNNEEAIKIINTIKCDGDCILVKASNGMKFKEIIENMVKQENKNIAENLVNI